MSTNLDDETLVAYLDGELPADEVTVVEQQLTQDETLRARLETLRVTGELIFDLPIEEPNDALAQSTIEMIALDLDDEPQGAMQWLRSHPWIVAICVCTIMIVAGGFAGSRLSGAFRSQLLDELPAIVDYDSLKNIEDLAWLEMLARESQDLTVFNRASGPRLIGDGNVPENKRERKAWVESLDEFDRGALLENMRAYFPDERHDRIRGLAESIYKDEARKKQLLQTARAYTALLEELGAKRANILASKPTAERLREVQSRVAEALWVQYATEMSAEDRLTIEDWLFNLRLNWSDPRLFNEFNELDAYKIREDLASESDDRIISREMVDALINDLSPRATAIIDSIESASGRGAALGLWCYVVLVPNTIPTVEELREQYGRLDEDEQDWLELLPGLDARSALRQRMESDSSNDQN